MCVCVRYIVQRSQQNLKRGCCYNSGLIAFSIARLTIKNYIAKCTRQPSHSLLSSTTPEGFRDDGNSRSLSTFNCLLAHSPETALHQLHLPRVGFDTGWNLRNPYPRSGRVVAKDVLQGIHRLIPVRLFLTGSAKRVRRGKLLREKLHIKERKHSGGGEGGAGGQQGSYNDQILVEM